ncbi:7199_t:CDS:2, partial [Gigaspora margarita]
MGDTLVNDEDLRLSCNIRGGEYDDEVIGSNGDGNGEEDHSEPVVNISFIPLSSEKEHNFDHTI